jgi:hypothetical protein
VWLMSDLEKAVLIVFIATIVSGGYRTLRTTRCRRKGLMLTVISVLEVKMEKLRYIGSKA